MLEWFESIAGPAYAPALMWTALALLVLVVLLLAVRLFRGFTSGTFVSGGRNRKARLAVMDATAVDSQRRLVLVRRDDVEHLVLIGGANDLVVERDIGREAAAQDRLESRLLAEPARSATPEPPARPAPQPARPAPEPRAAEPPRAAPQRTEPRMDVPQAEPPRRPVPPPPAKAAAPEPVPAARPEPRPEPAPEPVAQRPAPAPEPVAQRPAPPLRPAPVERTEPEFVRAEPSARPSGPPPAEPRPAPPVAATAAAAPVAAAPVAASPPPAEPDFDDVLLQELEQTLEDDAVRPPDTDPRAEPDLDAEMDRLLGDLSGDRR